MQIYQQKQQLQLIFIKTPKNAAFPGYKLDLRQTDKFRLELKFCECVFLSASNADYIAFSNIASDAAISALFCCKRFRIIHDGLAF